MPKKVTTEYVITSGSRLKWEEFRESLTVGEEFTISTSPLIAPNITIMTMLGAQKRGEVVLVTDHGDKTSTWRYLG